MKNRFNLPPLLYIVIALAGFFVGTYVFDFLSAILSGIFG